MICNSAACFPAGVLCVRLLWAAGGRGGFTGGRFLAGHVTWKPLHLEPLWQHWLIPRPHRQILFRACISKNHQSGPEHITGLWLQPLAVSVHLITAARRLTLLSLVNFSCIEKSVMHEAELALYWDIKEIQVSAWIPHNTNNHGMTPQNTVEHVGSQCTLVGNVASSLYWSDAAILEIPFAQNIMSVCVRAASRLVESLAPVKKRETWTLLKRKMEHELFHILFKSLLPWSDCC